MRHAPQNPLPLLRIAPFGVALAMAGQALALDLGQPEVTEGATELRNVNVAGWDKHDDGSPWHLHEFSSATVLRKSWR